MTPSKLNIYSRSGLVDTNKGPMPYNHDRRDHGYCGISHQWNCVH